MAVAPKSVLLALALALVPAAPAVGAPGRDMVPSIVRSAPPGGFAQPVGTNELISVRADGTAPKRASVTSDVSADGRYVAFDSSAKKLDPGAGRTHKRTHVYLRDRESGTTIAIDVRPHGRFGNGSSELGAVSADGRHVVFTSSTEHLAPGPSADEEDVYVRDTLTGTTTQVSVAADGGAADKWSIARDISADGSVVVFDSEATNLIADQQGNHKIHSYRRDLTTGTTMLVSKTPTGGYPNNHSESPVLSGDGNLVLYSSGATDIIADPSPWGYLLLYDVSTDTTIMVNRNSAGEPADGICSSAVISTDGTTIAYDSYATNLDPEDTNGVTDVFTYEVATQRSALVSRTSTGAVANNTSVNATIDADGSVVAFTSAASNLGSGEGEFEDDWDVFVRDLSTGVTTLVSHTPAGEAADGVSWLPRVAGDGSLVTYTSQASDLLDEALSQVDRVYAYRIS